MTGIQRILRQLTVLQAVSERVRSLCAEHETYEANCVPCQAAAAAAKVLCRHIVDMLHATLEEMTP